MQKTNTKNVIYLQTPLAKISKTQKKLGMQIRKDEKDQLINQSIAINTIVNTKINAKAISQT